MDAFYEILKYFKADDQAEMKEFSVFSPTEIRVRSGRRTRVLWIGGEGETGPIVTPSELRSLISRMLDHSVYAWEDELGEGYFTMTGGVRVGVTGKFKNDNGKTRLVAPNSLLIRIAHEIKGCAEQIRPFLLKGGCVQSMLILAPPGMGKTTLLRDACRLISKAGKEISVVDERGEIAAAVNGENRLDAGERTDVCEGIKKARAIMMLARSMSPDVIAVDEIGSFEDVEAISEGMRMGVSMLASAHASNVEDAFSRKMIRKILISGAFRYVCVLGGRPGNIKAVYRYSEGKWRLTSSSESQ